MKLNSDRCFSKNNCHKTIFAKVPSSSFNLARAWKGNPTFRHITDFATDTRNEDAIKIYG